MKTLQALVLGTSLLALSGSVASAQLVQQQNNPGIDAPGVSSKQGRGLTGRGGGDPRPTTTVAGSWGQATRRRAAIPAGGIVMVMAAGRVAVGATAEMMAVMMAGEAARAMTPMAHSRTVTRVLALCRLLGLGSGLL